MADTGRGVDVYVVDTGIFVEHSDFGGRAHKLYNAIKDGRDAGDCEGYLDCAQTTGAVQEKGPGGARGESACHPRSALALPARLGQS